MACVSFRSNGLSLLDDQPVLRFRRDLCQSFPRRSKLRSLMRPSPSSTCSVFLKAMARVAHWLSPHHMLPFVGADIRGQAFGRVTTFGRRVVFGAADPLHFRIDVALPLRADGG